MKPSKKKKDLIPFSKKSGFKILGLGKQDFIKYFFGGNATLAVILIALIVLFLVYHSYSFFPQYRQKLELYRLSGQEFSDYSSQQLDAQKKLDSLAIQAREYEVQYQLGPLYRVTSIHAEFKSLVLTKLLTERKNLKRAQARLQRIQDEDDASPTSLAEAQKSVTAATQALREAATKKLSQIDFSDRKDKSWAIDEKYLGGIRESIAENIATEKTTDFLKNIRKIEAEETEKITSQPHIVQLMDARMLFMEPQKQFEAYIDPLREIASTNKGMANAYKGAPDIKESLLDSAKLARTEEERERKLLEAERILLTEPDYATLNKPLYNSLPAHKIALQQLKVKTQAGFDKMPAASKFEGPLSKRRIVEITESHDALFEVFDERRQRMEKWDHTKPVTFLDPIKSFFLGKDWITNSSWQDFYGILPLLTGSFMVALVAICIAIPFAIGGAIYVNRLSSPFEQKFIKPIIEFIGAIPSIVMAFFGVVVLGSLLQEYSQSSLVSWIPSFPVEGRQSILGAGILLALMSVPTIFTLAEDALNNVPKSFREAALALGSTDMQTVFKIIIPSCASGIIAAILLGFGRIIGETMVVLLVMGGRIAIPKSITDPAHSMTGILAQEIGEVDEGSLHWAALFMVGLVLFIIALTLNYIAQTILRKLSKHN